MQASPENIPLPRDVQTEVNSKVQSVEAQQSVVRVPPSRVSVKYELFPFHNAVIKTLSVRNNLLVFGSSNQNDNIKICYYDLVSPTALTTLDSNQGRDNQNNKHKPIIKQQSLIAYRQIIVHNVINNRQNFIEWSPNGRYLAIGSVNVSIWMFDGAQFSRFKEFSDELFEVTAFTWCPNSAKYAVSGINSNLSIFVRNIETDQKIKQLKNTTKVLGLIWDPFDKHLAALMGSNEVNIYKTVNWEKLHTINLNLQASKGLKVNTKREDRKIDWSPDFRYLLVPALEDKTLPLVVALDRQRNFAVRSLFIGPFSSINCVKFNPNLYEFNGETINIFATGDNDGNISIWGLGERFTSKKPFFLLKSHKDQNLLIENIAWSEDGRVLFAATFKKYLLTAVIDETKFGRRLTSQEKRIHLQTIYGSIRAITSVQNTIQIFKYEEMLMKSVGNSANQKSLSQMINEESVAKSGQNGDKPADQYVFTQQKVINTQGRKRIMPSVLVKKTELDGQAKATPSVAVSEATALTINISPADPGQTISNAPVVKIPIQKVQPNRQENIPMNRIESDSGSQDIQEEIEEQDGEEEQGQNQSGSQISEQDNDNNEVAIVEQNSYISDASNNKNQIDQPKPAQTNNKPMQTQNPSELVSVEKTKEIIAQLLSQNAGKAAQKAHSSNTATAPTIVHNAPPQLKVSNQFALKLQRAKSVNSFWKIGTDRCIELQTGDTTSTIRYVGMRGLQRETLGTCFVNGRIESMYRNGEQMLAYSSDGYLYMFSLEGRALELPMLVGELHYFRANQDLDILTISTSCELRVFNLRKRKAYVRTSILPLVKQNLADLVRETDKQELSSVLDFAVPQNQTAFIQLRNKNSYIWNSDVETWSLVENGIYQVGGLKLETQTMQIEESFRTTSKKEETKNKQFFEQLLKPPNLGSLHKLEYSMVFYTRHQVDITKYKAVLLEYIKELIKLKTWNTLRQTLIRHFIDTSTQEFRRVQGDQVLLQEVMNIGGQIIEQFKFLCFGAIV